MADSDDLLFFGKVSASVSHELKNILAVINEQAGLLSDLAALAARGLPLDPDRLTMASTSLLRQVRRGDAILGHLNRFAHTADTTRREISLAETAALATALGQRQAAMLQVSLEAAPGTDAMVATDPFVLCRLLAACLEWAMASPDARKTITVAVEVLPEGPALVVAGHAPEAAPDDARLCQDLAERLGARLVRASGRLAIVWPPAS
jgi:C4-dicarboxylate-specific signal transduction histidine kinase